MVRSSTPRTDSEQNNGYRPLQAAGAIEKFTSGRGVGGAIDFGCGRTRGREGAADMVSVLQPARVILDPLDGLSAAVEARRWVWPLLFLAGAVSFSGAAFAL